MRRLDVLTFANAFSRLIDMTRVSVVATHMFRESFYGRAIKRRFPHIVHAHRAHTYIDCSWIPEWQKRLYHLADRFTSQYVDCYFANGAYLKDELVGRSRIPPYKVKIVLNASSALDGQAASSRCVPRRPLRPVVAMVANLLKHKGHDVLIKSLALLRSKGMRVQARLIGSTTSDATHVNELTTLAEQAGVLDQLEFFGFTGTITSALHGIDVLVLPSDSEGLPNCILEGMNLRKIVVASRVGAVPEIITDGRDGFMHPPQDPLALAEILFRIFSAPSDSLIPIAEAAHDAWRTRFSHERMIGEFAGIYRNDFGLEVF
jgi:glycosyltransferase involved in cell wall biosynthesis